MFVNRCCPHQANERDQGSGSLYSLRNHVYIHTQEQVRPEISLDQLSVEDVVMILQKLIKVPWLSPAVCRDSLIIT